MAKDPTQSRIPRLDGVTRIPMPGAIRPATVQKSQIAISQPKTIVAPHQRPVSYEGTGVAGGTLRTSTVSITSLKKSMSGEKIVEAARRTTAAVKKLLTKPTAAGATVVNSIDTNKIQDNTVILDKEMKDDANQKLLTRSDCGQPTTVHNETRTLMRSETFVRDSNSGQDSILLSLTHNIVDDQQSMQVVSENSPGSLFVTRTMNATDVSSGGGTFDTTVTMATNNSKQKCDPAGPDATITIEDSGNCPALWKTPGQIAISHVPAEFVDDTKILAPDKSSMNLALNSTMNFDRLVDVSMTLSPSHQLMNIAREIGESPQFQQNNTKLLYITHASLDQTLTPGQQVDDQEESRIDDESMEIDEDLPSNVLQMFSANQIQELKMTTKPRYSFGADLTECTLDCSIELCDVSIGSNVPAQVGSPLLKKQNSFEMDESLGILTPDQMKEFLDSNTTNTNLDLPINVHGGAGKITMHQMRIDQTPSPEDLPLDPVGVKTDLVDVIMSTQPMAAAQNTIQYHPQEISQTDSYSKTEQMTKSNVSKASNSFITSITSITSLDTGYQGDGEMSRPASRGAGDHSPSNGPRKPHLGRQPSFNHNGQVIPIRRQDPMTDSDFFTESDADDIFHRGDRRAQVIDGQLYGPMLQPANIFITEQPQMEDSCMESSGIFTDVENRCDDDIAQSRGGNSGGRGAGDLDPDVDMSPDGSTDTIKSNNVDYNASQQHQQQPNQPRSSSALSQGHSNILTDSQTSSTIQSSISSERINLSSTATIGAGAGATAGPSDAQTQASSISKASLKSTSKSSPARSTGSSNGASMKSTTTTTTTTRSHSASLPHRTGDDKKSSSSAKKLQQNASSVKKLSASRKQLQYSGGSSNDSGTAAAAIIASSNNNDAKTTIAKKSSPASLRSSGSYADEDESSTNSAAGSDMLVKNGTPIKTRSPRNSSTVNQENRRPRSVNGISGSVAVLARNHGLVGSGAGGSNPNLQCSGLRKVSPNKWDAVMDKIAENKALKKNYSQVKSKISTGMLLRRNGGGGSAGGSTGGGATTRIIKSPTGRSQESNCGSASSGSGLSSPQAKCLIQGPAKRGRSFSKDSQQSSQSDLSLSGGSSKNPVKTSPNARSAKKRDVRTLSISPTDLGPPPKTQTNNTTVRTKQQPVLAQKRISPNNLQATTTVTNPSPPLGGSKQGSPPPKKVTSRRPQVQQAHTKVPLKDHNRLVSHTQQQQQQQQQQNNNSNSPKSGINHAAIKSITINSTQPANATLTSTTVGAATTLVCGGLKSSNRTAVLTQSPPPNILHSNNSNNSPSSILQQSHKHKQQQQQLQHPQIKSSKGAVDFHLVHANKGFEALGVLLQYLVYDLDAFSCPKVKSDYGQIKQCLYETQRQLEEARTMCNDLQDQLHEKDLYYTTRESEIQTLHRCELEKVQTSLAELESSAQDRIRSLETEIISKDAGHAKKLKEYMQQTETRLLEKNQELESARDKEQDLLRRITILSTTENELRDKIQIAEQNFSERLGEAAQRERELVERVNTLSKELELLRNVTGNRERELEDKLNLSHDEISVLRNSRKLYEESLLQRSPSATAAMSNGQATKVQMLQEVESLRSVLELKQTEISELRKQNQELKRTSDDVPSLYMKVSALESKIEDLQIRLKAKTADEKELNARNKHLHDSYKQELELRGRLSLHNEQLQWRLKQNSEKFALALSELSKSYNDQNSSFANTSKSSLNSQDYQPFGSASAAAADQLSSHNSSLASLNRTNGSDRSMIGCFQMDDISPPASPIIKGVVEKADSVSWVLEMDDETPEVLASRMIRRAGSFRSSFNEKSSPSGRRQNSLPAGSTPIAGGNPLMQSASATSVLRQHSSNDPVASMNLSLPIGGTTSRIRSKSVTIKSSDPKKLTRQNSNESRRENGGSLATSWKDPISSSSPYKRRQRSSSLKQQFLVSPTANYSAAQVQMAFSQPDSEESVVYRKPNRERNLITCDTSALTASDRLDIRSLPSHPSVQDLKGMKKCHEIQESAGEAMVSGTNSEDEGCSASSDDLISSGSAASTTSSLDCDGKQNVLSLEDALMGKIGGGSRGTGASLGGTPMEVSWSDEYQNESVV